MTQAGLKGRCFLKLKPVLLEVGYIKIWPKFAYLELKVPHLKFRVMQDRVYMYMYFNSSIRPVDRNKDTTITCISVRPVQCANTVLLLSYLLQCISLHYYPLLLLVQPCPDGIQMAHNLGAKLLIYLVGVAAEAGHIGGTAPVRELFINEYFLVTVMFYFYLSLNGNKITSVIRPA